MTEEQNMRTRPTLALFGALLAAFLYAAPALAHEGEDHSKDKKASLAPIAAAPATSAAAADREAPARLGDGGLFVPKPVQRQLGLRTVRTVMDDLSATVELNGRVISEPGAGGRIQATQAGTVVPGPRGFPALGTRVRKGEVVAQLRPLVSSLERAGEVADQADLAAQQQVAERRAQRLMQLEGSVPAKEIEAAQIEARALRDRLTARRAGLDVVQPLLAPASGIVGVVHVVAGEVVDGKDILFEIIDPDRLAVEALSYDPTLPARLKGITEHEAQAGDARLALRLTGAGLQLREQALPMQFRIVSASVPVAVGQPVKVLARAAGGDKGVALPKSALSMNNAGETVLWVHTGPERFESRRVAFRALGTDRVAIISGLSAGERVVVSGATLLAQVR
jgi:hypothetical protein